MATCPACGANSRTDPTFHLDEIEVAKPPGTFSLAGHQMKVVITTRTRLSHSCGWWVIGRVEGEYFEPDNVQPEGANKRPVVHTEEDPNESSG